MGSCCSCCEAVEEIDMIRFDRGYHNAYMNQVDAVLDKKIEGDVSGSIRKKVRFVGTRGDGGDSEEMYGV